MDWYKNLAENIATSIIGNAHDKFFKEGKNLDFMGVTVFEEADSFSPGKMVDAFSAVLNMTKEELNYLIDLTIQQNISTWGILYYLRGLARLNKRINISELIGKEKLNLLKQKLHYRTFLTDDLKLKYPMPTNYLGCAFAICLYRENLGWENEDNSHKILTNLMEHVSKFSKSGLYSDEGNGEGRFDRYTFLLPAELCERLIDCGKEVPSYILTMLRKSCDVVMMLDNDRGAGFNYGRSIGIYGDTAVMEILSVAAYLGVLKNDELETVYSYCQRVAKRITWIWFDKEKNVFDMWSDGKKGDNYLSPDRALGDNLSVSMHLINTFNLWKKVDIEEPSSEDEKQFYFETFANDENMYALAIFKDKGYSFSIPFISGGSGRYLHSAYFPVPQEGSILVCPPSSPLPMLTPVFLTKKEECLSPIVFFKNIKHKENGEKIYISYEMDGICLIGGLEPKKDNRIKVKSEYFIEPGIIERHDVYTIDETIDLKCVVMEFANFLKPVKKMGNKVIFSGDGIKSFEARGLDIVNIMDVSKEKRYSTPIGNLKGLVQYVRDTFVPGKPIEITWTLTY